ncbi:hypothetical protein RHOSPDRAFT_37480 [Rhodotorula sp. JG-1b]|nr:hypothetical protein RHOSPDRAFT_37480 [Rhodotorula sp. JG-1b]
MVRSAPSTMVRTSQPPTHLSGSGSSTLCLRSAIMEGGPDHKKQREGKRPRSPPTDPDSLPFTPYELKERRAVIEQRPLEARAAALPFLKKEVAVRKRAWEAKWTGNVASVGRVSSADIIELKLKKSAQRITTHEELFLRLLLGRRESDYAQARENLVKSTLKDYNRAMILRILKTRRNRW